MVTHHPPGGDAPGEMEKDMKKYSEKMVQANNILVDAQCNSVSLYDAAEQAEIAGCGEEFLRVVKNCTFYQGTYLFGGMTGKPIPYAGGIRDALKNLPVYADFDVYIEPHFGNTYEARTEVRRLCEVYAG